MVGTHDRILKWGSMMSILTARSTPQRDAYHSVFIRVWAIWFPPVGAIHELPLLVETRSSLACKDPRGIDKLVNGS
jgi:hypothetical protein